MPEILGGRFLFCLFFAGVTLPAVGKPLLIRNVSVRPAFFNPSLQQLATLSFTLTSAGETDILVLDRDGVPVRRLVSHTRYAAGSHAVSWNGRTDSGEVVADEAWSFRIDVHDGKTAATYFPALDNRLAKMTEIPVDSWDAVSGILRYTLPFPARVHVQAGSAVVDPKTKHIIDGPVLKTVVNREPRVAGAVIEQWDGLDESRTIHVVDLPHFGMAIAATPLPESSVITVGNRRTTFVSTLATRRGRSLLPPAGSAHMHHQGLTAIQDVSPPLRVDVRNAGSGLNVTATVTGPTAAAFVAQHGGVLAYIDGNRVKTLPVVTQNPVEMSIDVGSLSPGSHILALNWGSPYGPVAVNSLRFSTTTGGTR